MLYLQYLSQIFLQAGILYELEVGEAGVNQFLKILAYDTTLSGNATEQTLMRQDLFSDMLELVSELSSTVSSGLFWQASFDCR
jgi:hypothetical protein